jgi:hypothetical protein
LLKVLNLLIFTLLYCPGQRAAIAVSMEFFPWHQPT